MTADTSYRTQVCEQIAADIVKSMDMDDLIEYAVDQMTNYFKNLDDDQLSEELADHDYMWVKCGLTT